MLKEYFTPNLQDYEAPTFDMDEFKERTHPNGVVYRYRHIHGEFKNLGLKFLICLPEKDKFTNRFFQYLSPFPGQNEEIICLDMKGENDRLSFNLEHGAMLVESNMGGPRYLVIDNKMYWKNSAIAAALAIKIAKEYYQVDRIYGYVYGGSGGGYKTLACIENVKGIWDGAAPYVIGSPVSLPNTITMHAQGQRVLRHAFRKIIDNVDVGGSGNPTDGLNKKEAFMLNELINMGFNPLSWYLEDRGIISDGAMSVLIPTVYQNDPTFFKDYWEKEGYLGHDNICGEQDDRLKFKTKIISIHSQDSETQLYDSGVDTAWKKQLNIANNSYIEVDFIPKKEDLYLKGVNLIANNGNRLNVENIINKGNGGIIVIGDTQGVSIVDTLKELKIGEEINIDNSDYIAFQSYYRHQVPKEKEFHAWDQFRNDDGTPNLPQRENVMGYTFTGVGVTQDGDIQGKVILTQALLDESTCPWCGNWYKSKIIEKGNINNFRINYMERCLHGDTLELESTMVVNYLGALRQAILDLSNWVEKGIEPNSSSNYDIVGNIPVVKENAIDRNGTQPVIKVTINNCKKVIVNKNEEFEVKVEITNPIGTGLVTYIDASLEDDRKALDPSAFKLSVPFEIIKNNDGLNGAIATFKHKYEELGEHFISVRVKANRNGNKDDIYTQIKNLDRVRIIVK